MGLFKELTTRNFNKKLKFIKYYSFNDVVLKRFKDKTELSNESVFEVIFDLKIYFIAVLLKQSDKNDKGLILMYNQTVDELWHTLILDTIAYNKFCIGAFGKFLHHQLTENSSQQKLEYSEQITNEYIEKAIKLMEEN